MPLSEVTAGKPLDLPLLAVDAGACGNQCGPTLQVTFDLVLIAADARGPSATPSFGDTRLGFLPPRTKKPLWWRRSPRMTDTTAHPIKRRGRDSRRRRLISYGKGASSGTGVPRHVAASSPHVANTQPGSLDISSRRTRTRSPSPRLISAISTASWSRRAIAAQSSPSVLSSRELRRFAQ